MQTLSIDHINDLIEAQLQTWQEAKVNFDRLREIERKPMPLGDFPVAAQLNPARIRSTGASVDKESISKRSCFLCKANRPEEQMSGTWPTEEWELLVNPFPILPVHFTIASTKHIPQAEIPADMAIMAENAPSLTFFYNGARAGASAPDHLHCQAMLKSELPIVDLVEKHHPEKRGGWMSSEEYGLDLPFNFMSAIIKPGLPGMFNLSRALTAFGIDSTTGEKDTGLINAFFWISDSGFLRIVIVPRRAHRPSLYFLPERERYMISPGAVDMAGLIIVPREEDFHRLSPEIISRIYAETAFAEPLPEEIKANFRPPENLLD